MHKKFKRKVQTRAKGTKRHGKTRDIHLKADKYVGKQKY